MVEIMNTGRIFIVSNRLPVSVVETNGDLVLERSIGGLATALDTVADRYKAVWVGWNGSKRMLSTAELGKVGFPDNLIPVQMEQSLMEGYYDRFSNGQLWPGFHDMPSPQASGESDWGDYCEANRRFAAVLRHHLKPGDKVWVHDYHLMMLPGYLKQMGVDIRVGFFLHIPFPSADTLSHLPHVQEILASLRAADVLGVQTRRDAERLEAALDRSSLDAGSGLIRAYPIGINFGAYQNAIDSSKADTMAKAYAADTKGKKIIFSLSRLDYTKGILNQLEAVERFLAAEPDREAFVYKLIVAPSREQIDAYAQLKDKIELKVDDINSRLGSEHWKPVDYVYENLGFQEVAAWYGLADVMLLLPDIDGMNLIAKEYIAGHGSGSGALVLSRGAGAAFQLTDALLVPPGDVQAAALALRQAITMSPAERDQRWRALRQSVSNEDIFWWAERFISDLTAA